MELNVLAFNLMNRQRLLIAAVVVASDVLLAVVSPPVFVSLNVTAVWIGISIGIRSAFRWWKQRLFVQRAQSVSDIRRIDYFRRVPGPQLENWLLAAFEARGFLPMGDPFLARSLDQGFVWRSGKMAALFIQQERQLTEYDLKKIWASKNKCRVDNVFVFSPFSSAPKGNRHGLEILVGQEFLSWMSVLAGVRPVNIGTLAPQNCSCGARQEEWVSLAGEPLLICSRYPDCREAPQPAFGEPVSAIAA